MKTVLAVAVACGLVYAQGSSPNGSYGFLLNEYTNDSSEADTSGFAVIGVMNFDGMGNATGTYTVVNGGSPSTSKSGTLTGTYSGNSNGTGTLNVTADSGGTLTFATVTTDQGNGFQMVLTASNFAIAGLGVGLAGSQTSLTGNLPAPLLSQLLGGSVTGNIPLTLTGTTGNGVVPMTVYTATGASGSGTASCGNGTNGTWNATVPNLTVATPLPGFGPGGGGSGVGDFLLSISYTACGNSQSQTVIGQVNGQVTPNGGINMALQMPGSVMSGFARAAAPGVSLSGSYGLAATNSPLPASITGVLQFDGMGDVTVSLTGVGTAGNGSNTQPVPTTGGGSGTYTINSDGSGQFSWQNANGATPTYAFVITDGGSQILFLRTDSHNNQAVAFGTARAE